jgi:guanylate kinase
MFGKIARKLKLRLQEATKRIALAETELSTAMAELTVTDRADKQIVGERLRKAMAELVSARVGLAEIVETSR